MKHASELRPILLSVVTHFTYSLQPSATARLNFVKEVVAAFPALRASVADLGCGSGVILSEILMMKPLWTGYGLDISQEAVSYARRLAAHKQVNERAEFDVGNVTHLPYPDESLNLIIASEIIEHMPEPEMVVGEIARVLKPGGQLILTMPIESHTPGHIHTLSSLEDLPSFANALAESSPAGASLALRLRRRPQTRLRARRSREEGRLNSSDLSCPTLWQLSTVSFEPEALKNFLIDGLATPQP